MRIAAVGVFSREWIAVNGNGFYSVGRRRIVSRQSIHVEMI